MANLCCVCVRVFYYYYFKKKKKEGGGLALSDYWCKRKQAGLVKSHFLKNSGSDRRGRREPERSCQVLAVTSKTDRQEGAFQQRPAGGGRQWPLSLGKMDYFK